MEGPGIRRREEFIELAGKVNQQTPYFCIEKVERALNEARKPVRDSGIRILGVAYKAGVADTREVTGAKIMRILARRGARLTYHDPHVPELPEFGLRNAELDAVLSSLDLAVIVTAHPGIDYSAVAERAPAMLDLRGVMRPHATRGSRGRCAPPERRPKRRAARIRTPRVNCPRGETSGRRPW